MFPVEDYDGPITWRRALAMSRNMGTIHVGETIGFDRVAALWKKVGVGQPPQAFPSIVLGVFQLTAIEVAQAYTLFVNGGRVRPLTSIQRIETAEKELRPKTPTVKRAAREDTTYLVTNMMRSVLNEGTAAGTRAVRDGDGWRVTGQKIWSTDAQWADMGTLLARTDPSGDRHAGITAFVIPMDLPGIEVRPIREMTGYAEFCEVFFDETPVGPEHVLGTVDDGWRVITSGLASERAFVGADAIQAGSSPSVSRRRRIAGTDTSNRSASSARLQPVACACSTTSGSGISSSRAKALASASRRRS